ncbi:MAG: hypothetical protein V1708_06285 [Candidatus Micrarchaeota archaeon]
MGIFELFGKKKFDAGGATFKLDLELHPMRLAAHKQDYVDLELSLQNATDTEVLTSIVITLPKELGFEQSALSHQKEIRLSQLHAGELRHLKVQVWGTQRTAPANYAIHVYAIAHYRDYGYVLNEVRRKIELRAA